MNNWLKQNLFQIKIWKWYHWLAYYLLFFVICSAVFFIQHRLFGYPFHMANAAFGAAGGTVGMALAMNWRHRRAERKRR